MSDINVVPYIDVMLVLLIIFMVTAPLLKQGVEVDLPQAPAQPLDSDSPEPVVISVDVSGRTYLNIAPDPDSPLEPTVLIELVRAARVADQKRPVMVRGDRNGVYQNVIGVLVALQAAGIDTVGLVTEPGEEPR
jgi:biopolymer transport protein TolR